jgi:hypothetical protein
VFLTAREAWERYREAKGERIQSMLRQIESMREQWHVADSHLAP